MVSKPKPLKSDRKRVKIKSTSDQPKKEPLGKRKKRVERQLEAMVKALIFWRDAQECVQKSTDGHRCGNGLMWGHYIAQGQSAWLRYDLSNVFVQCGNHNQLDYRGDKSYSVWYISTFGLQASIDLEKERDEHRGKTRSLTELEEMLDKCASMFIIVSARYKTFGLDDLADYFMDRVVPDIKGLLNESSNNDRSTSRQ